MRILTRIQKLYIYKRITKQSLELKNMTTELKNLLKVQIRLDQRKEIISKLEMLFKITEVDEQKN